MAISVTCDSCGHEFDAPKESVDSETSCPECGEAVSIPESSEPSEDGPELELGPEATNEEESEEQRADDSTEADSTPESSSDASDEEEATQNEQEQDQEQEPGQNREDQGEDSIALAGRFHIIVQSIPVGLKPDTLCISAAGMFLSALVFYLFWILSMQFSSTGNQLIFSLVGLGLGLTISFETFTAVSRLSMSRFRDKPVPEWSDLVSFLVRNTGKSLLIPFGMILAGVSVLILEYLLGWVGAIPYFGGVFLFVLVFLYLLLNLSLLILLVLGLWFTFPILTVDQGNPFETGTVIYEYIRDHFWDSLVHLGMVLLVMMVLKWLIFAFFVGSFSLTMSTLSDQTVTYVNNTFQEDGGESALSDSPFGPGGIRRQPTGLFQSVFGQLIFALIFSVFSAVVVGPVMAIFYSGGCKVYLSSGHAGR